MLLLKQWKTLAENAGLDQIDVVTRLKASSEKWGGIDVFTGEIMDSWKQGVIEPLKIKTQALSSATEVAEMILRIDDVVLGGKGRDSAAPSHMNNGMMPPNEMM